MENYVLGREERKQLLLMLCQHEADRLEVWAQPIGSNLLEGWIKCNRAFPSESDHTLFIWKSFRSSGLRWMLLIMIFGLFIRNSQVLLLVIVKSIWNWVFQHLMPVARKTLV